MYQLSTALTDMVNIFKKKNRKTPPFKPSRNIYSVYFSQIKRLPKAKTNRYPIPARMSGEGAITTSSILSNAITTEAFTIGGKLKLKS